jgi:hypothetical protein
MPEDFYNKVAQLMTGTALKLNDTNSSRGYKITIRLLNPYGRLLFDSNGAIDNIFKTEEELLQTGIDMSTPSMSYINDIDIYTEQSFSLLTNTYEVTATKSITSTNNGITVREGFVSLSYS